VASWAAEYLAERAIKYGALVASRETGRTGVVQGSFTIPAHWSQAEVPLFCWADGNRCEVEGGSQPCLANDEPYEPGGRYLVIWWDDQQQPADVTVPPRLDRVRAGTVRLVRANPAPRRRHYAPGLRDGEIEVPDGPPPDRPRVIAPPDQPPAGLRCRVRSWNRSFHLLIRMMMPLSHTCCRDCGWDTYSDEPGALTEWYLVTAKVWQAAMHGEPGGQLCIGCLEKRIGRRLTRADFVNHQIHDLSLQNLHPSWSWRSERLTGRLRAGA
jgi:hypothetical protein